MLGGSNGPVNILPSVGRWLLVQLIDWGKLFIRGKSDKLRSGSYGRQVQRWTDVVLRDTLFEKILQSFCRCVIKWTLNCPNDVRRPSLLMLIQRRTALQTVTQRTLDKITNILLKPMSNRQQNITEKLQETYRRIQFYSIRQVSNGLVFHIHEKFDFLFIAG